MSNVFDYLAWRGDLLLEQEPFNEVDGAILARFAYAPFELMQDSVNDVPASIKDAARSLLVHPDIESKVLMKIDLKLLANIAESERFQNMKIFAYENVYDVETQVQFSAVTIQLDSDLYFVAFRGTDSTFIGWKEDFNMSFICPVPSQEMAVKYLDKIAKTVNGRFIVGGHSKGGNLSVYASAFCEPSFQERIDAIYNFDGPGFDKSILSTDGYKNICDRIKTYIPQSSIVGLLLEHEEEYTIVHSAQAINVLQHDILSWDVQRNHFEYLETVTNSSKFIDSTLKAWIADMASEQREKFIDAVYLIISQTNLQSFKDLNNNNYIASAKAITNSIKNLDDGTRQAVIKALLSLAKCAKDVIADSFRKNTGSPEDIKSIGSAENKD